MLYIVVHGFLTLGLSPAFKEIHPLACCPLLIFLFFLHKCSSGISRAVGSSTVGSLPSRGSCYWGCEQVWGVSLDLLSTAGSPACLFFCPPAPQASVLLLACSTGVPCLGRCVGSWGGSVPSPCPLGCRVCFHSLCPPAVPIRASANSRVSHMCLVLPVTHSSAHMPLAKWSPPLQVELIMPFLWAPPCLHSLPTTYFTWLHVILVKHCHICTAGT